MDKDEGRQREDGVEDMVQRHKEMSLRTICKKFTHDL